ncbi:DNA-binding protein [Yersinia enterocolitica]|uniref:DNA-binding protein n=1 Tax=Yersinia TaxID=629 RepID=UPI001C608898|nr:DNA-binding protein [Yersinia kristensenii]EKN3970328.1 DNA-binding protein [Yersinia enterocolitica]EKN4025681.1 DNA-binding protein [Yersinia enterocolitica]EKN4769338.1 DNA-binding protein [Yersinia enterocolitica]EKN5146694.1 DNA-binding protein [Yersinia enterocolitica]EKN5955830.1 DNA-binding protein [Yersinia enterocolitica]
MSDAKKVQPRVRAPSIMPSDYPYWDDLGNPLLSESIEAYAKRIGKNPQTTRWNCDVGNIPVIQLKKGGKRSVNLYAIYLLTKRGAEEFVKKVGY